MPALTGPMPLALGLSVDTLAPLRDWAMAHFGVFRPNRPWRQYGVLDELERMGVPRPPGELDKIRLLAAEAAGVDPDLPQEVLLGHFCGVIFHSGAVHRHRDTSIPGKRITRTNVMVQDSPGGGGVPVIEGVEVPVATGDGWVFHPDRMTHWTTEVFGGPRIVFSFGYLEDDR